MLDVKRELFSVAPMRRLISLLAGARLYSNPRKLMKRILLLLCCSFVALSGTFAGPKKEPTLDDPKAIKKWVDERVKNAKDSKTELVRFAMVGCIESATCPSYWAIGFTEHMEEDQSHRWFLPITDGLKLPQSGWVGGVAEWGPVLLVEGYFTGVKRMPTDAEGFAEATESKLAEFKILRFTNASQTKADRVLKIVATGEEALKKVETYSDAKPWLVLASSKPLFDAASEKDSNDLKDKLIAAGFTEAEVFDSRKAKNLFCCYLVVVAGRYSTKEDAQAAVKQAKTKGFTTYAKQGW
jgi:hypothetical protein